MHRLPIRIRTLCVYLFVLTFQTFSLSNFTTFQSVIKINDIVTSGNIIWAASSGGLLRIDLAQHSQTFFSDNNTVPDINLTALAVDSKGNLWIGSKLGYLYKRTPDGRYTIYDSYYSVQWAIQDIYIYNDYIFVGASQGLGLFDPAKGISIRNATAVDSSLNVSINVITVHHDSLYVGCQTSYDAFDISGNKFLNSNYLDLSLWTSTYTQAPIVSFIDSNGTLIPETTPALAAGGSLYRTDGEIDSVSFFTADSQEVYMPATSVNGGNHHASCIIPGAITTMISDKTGTMWIGTDQNFLYSWNGTTDPVQYKIPGLTDGFAGRVYAAKNGTIWLLPLASDNPSWWDGIRSYDGKQWRLFNRFSTPGIGSFNGGPPDFTGICEDKNGNMWFGTSGSNVKLLDVRKNLWTTFQFSGYVWDSIRPLSLAEMPFYWGKHDALCQDSSGYIWVANFSNTTQITSGCLICYNPWQGSSPDYRRFFPNSDQYSIMDIVSLCTDSRGNIFAGGKDGKLLILNYQGNPIASGVGVEMFRTDLSTVYKIISTANGITWIVTGNGLYKYTSSHANTGSLQHIDSLQGTFSSIAAETDSILWLGTRDKGLVRYDAGKDSSTTIDMTSGLVSNAVNDIDIDKKNGYLWIGTPDGVSRYYLGHSAVAVADNASMIAYPNPFSLTNIHHREIVFAHCAPGANVCIYNMSGSLVKVLTSGKDDAYTGPENGFESTLHWIPSKKTPPGTYYYIGQSQKPVKTKKLLIIP